MTSRNDYTTHQLCNLQCSYSQHVCFKTQRQMPEPYIVKEALYLELSTLEGHQTWNVTCCIPMSSTNVSITYTVITTIETQPLIIQGMIHKSL